MNSTYAVSLRGEPELHPEDASLTWVAHAALLWHRRRFLAWVTAVSLIMSIGVAFLIPKRYEAVARIMPPDQQGAGAMMLAALTARANGLGSLAGNFMAGHFSSTALFVDLLQSGAVSGHLIDRYHLQQVYRKRYRVDTAKKLARRTTITDDKKSGVIIIKVWDNDPARARDLAQGYLEELNKLVTQTNTSSAHQERIFIEHRLQSVEADLERAELEFSDFSSRNSTIDIKEQTSSLVGAAAKVQAEVLVEQAGLDSLRQIYGDGNIRVRESQARIASLERDLVKMSGSSATLTPAAALESPGKSGADDGDEISPPMRQLPRLAVPYADLYRRVKAQENVFDLLTQQYEMARIEEAKDVPVVSVIDPPVVPEKKMFPPRLLLALSLTVICFMIASAVLLIADHWSHVDANDPRKQLALDVVLKICQLSQLRLWRASGSQ